MGYRIEYNNGKAQKTQVFYKTSEKPRRAVSVFVILMLAFLALYRFGQGNLGQKLIPGDAIVTKAAATKFADEIRHGTPFVGAFYAFCKEIIDGASIQDIY